MMHIFIFKPPATVPLYFSDKEVSKVEIFESENVKNS